MCQCARSLTRWIPSLSSLVYQLPYFSAPRPRLFGRTCKPCELAAFLSTACCAATKCQITQRKACSGVLVERQVPWFRISSLISCARPKDAWLCNPFHGMLATGQGQVTICIFVFVGSQPWKTRIHRESVSGWGGFRLGFIYRSARRVGSGLNKSASILYHLTTARRWRSGDTQRFREFQYEI